jgi:hypothetical protein
LFIGTSLEESRKLKGYGKGAAPRERGAPLSPNSGELSAKDEVCCFLCLGCGVNQKLAIIAKLGEPAGDIRGLVLDHDR